MASRRAKARPYKRDASTVFVGAGVGPSAVAIEPVDAMRRAKRASS
jgi:hypothetical protein